MHSSTFGKGWVGMSACPLVVLACESLHVNDVCTVSGAVNTQGFVWKFFMRYVYKFSFIHFMHTAAHADIRSTSICLDASSEICYPKHKQTKPSLQNTVLHITSFLFPQDYH